MLITTHIKSVFDSSEQKDYAGQKMQTSFLFTVRHNQRNLHDMLHDIASEFIPEPYWILQAVTYIIIGL